MVGAICQGSLQTNNGIACQHAALYTFLQALFNRREILLGNGAAEDFFFKDNRCCGIIAGLKFHHNVTKLTMTAGLLFITTANGCFCLDGFSVRDDGVCQINLNLIFCFQLLHHNIQLLFANAINQRLFGFGVYFHLNRGVFLTNLCQGCGKLILIALALRFDCHAKHGARQRNLGNDNICILQGKGILCGGVGKLCQCADITGVQLIHLNLLLPTHNIQTSNLFDGILFFIIDTHGSIQLTCHHAEQVQAADIGVGNGFEYIRREAFVIGGAINNVLPVMEGMEVCLCFDCRKGEANDCVHQKLNAIAQCCGTAHNGCNAVVCDTNLQTVIDFLFGQFLIIEEFFHQLFTGFCRYLNQHGAQNLNLILFILRHFAFFQLAVYLLSGISLNQIDKADEVAVFIIKGNLQGGNGFAEVFTQISQCFFKVCIFIIHLVNENDTGQVHFFAVFPCLFRTDLYAGFCGNHNQPCIRYVHCQLYLGCKVKVTGSIQEVNLCILPFNGNYRCIDRNLTANFFCFIVGHSVSIFHLAESLRCTGIIQRCFGICGFTGTAVAQKNYVSHSVRCIIFHRIFPPIGLFLNGFVSVKGLINVYSAQNMYNLYITLNSTII